MPRVRTITNTVYSFDELSDEAKERAREWWRELEVEDMDLSHVLEWAAEAGRVLGIEIDTHNGGDRPRIYFDDLGSGGGACFEGSYYANTSSKITEFEYRASVAAYSDDKELHRIAGELCELQTAYRNQLYARMDHRGRYHGSSYMDVNVHADDLDVVSSDEEAVTQLMRDFADWIYKRLTDEYEWRLADEQVDESIIANEYEFDEDGSRA